MSGKFERSFLMMQFIHRNWLRLKVLPGNLFLKDQKSYPVLRLYGGEVTLKCLRDIHRLTIFLGRLQLLVSKEDFIRSNIYRKIKNYASINDRSIDDNVDMHSMLEYYMQASSTILGDNFIRMSIEYDLTQG